MQARAMEPTSSARIGTSPADDGEALFAGQAFDALTGGVGFGRDRREEGGADGVLALSRKLEVENRAEELVGDLRQQAGAVAGAFVSADGAAVLEAPQGMEGVGHDVVAGFTAQGGDDGEATGVLLLLGAVKP